MPWKPTSQQTPNNQARARSFRYLCKQAGLSAPSGLADFDTKITRKPRAAVLVVATKQRRMTRREREIGWLRAELDAAVARGEFYKTPDGRYGLPEWLSPDEKTQLQRGV